MVQPEPNEGPKLVANGATILLGGSPVRIVFDQRAFVEIEKRWGSLSAYWNEIQKGIEGKLFTCVADAIAATVRGMPVDPVSLMDTRRLVEYARVIGPAFLEAMPSLPEEEGQPGSPTSVEADRPLTGAPSSSSESFASGWRPPTSGP